MFLSENCENEKPLQDDLTKKKPKTKVNYFDIREEDAVKLFLLAETAQEKNQIYNEFLRKPIDKMIESIIRRYKLYRKDMDFNEIHNDTHSFLMTKVDKFKPSKNKKAYSYFGTICKNYLMGQILKEQKEQNKKISYEDISTMLENRPDMIYYLEYEKIQPEQVIIDFLNKLEVFIEKNDLNSSELKLGYALIELFSNYDEIFIGTDNNKFNKNIILLSLREMTNMSTKEIRTSMKKFRVLYFEISEKLNNL
jgi:ribosome-binding protein aMBF1 (putative translation factor)